MESKNYYLHTKIAPAVDKRSSFKNGPHKVQAPVRARQPAEKDGGMKEKTPSKRKRAREV